MEWNALGLWSRGGVWTSRGHGGQREAAGARGKLLPPAGGFPGRVSTRAAALGLALVVPRAAATWTNQLPAGRVFLRR